MRLFSEKNSYDLFLVVHQVFRIFPFFSVSFAMFNVVYDPFLTRTTAISENNSFTTPFFLLCSYFRAHPTTLLLKILGARMHGPSPTSNFWGDRPQSPWYHPQKFYIIMQKLSYF